MRHKTEAEEATALHVLSGSVLKPKLAMATRGANKTRHHIAPACFKRWTKKVFMPFLKSKFHSRLEWNLVSLIVDGFDNEQKGVDVSG